MEKGALVQFVDHEGNKQIGKIENVNTDHCIYRIRTSKWTLYNVNWEDATEYHEEVAPVVEGEVKTKPLQYKEWILDNWKTYLKYAGFWAFVLLLIANAIYRYENRTELEKLTAKLNDINEQKVPLMESCSQLRQKNVEASDILNQMKSWEH